MDQSAKNAIQIENLSVNYRHTRALQNVCLNVPEGEFLGIIGPNGGGKSTLLKAILGLVPPASGKIEIFGEERKKNQAVIGYVPQFSTVDRTFPISAQEVVLTAFLKGPLHPFFRYKEEHRRAASAALERVGIENLASRQISELSGGEFQRLLIVRALATEPKILLLDEPTASVDPASREHIYELLTEINKSVTIVMVTHDLMAIASEVTSIACLNQTLVYHGGPQLDEKTVNAMYGCPVDLIAHGVPHRVLGRHDHDCRGGREDEEC
ncbi:MAG: ABC transporter ATP-binding protein [Clostridiales bacterium]|nr:ABC transporter ATP-binding protein [Clostridiales bacterium]